MAATNATIANSWEAELEHWYAPYGEGGAFPEANVEPANVRIIPPIDADDATLPPLFCMESATDRDGNEVPVEHVYARTTDDIPRYLHYNGSGGAEFTGIIYTVALINGNQWVVRAPPNTAAQCYCTIKVLTKQTLPRNVLRHYLQDRIDVFEDDDFVFVIHAFQKNGSAPGPPAEPPLYGTVQQQAPTAAAASSKRKISKQASTKKQAPKKRPPPR